MFRYEKWLKEKLGILKFKAKKKKLTRHEKKYIGQKQAHIRSLFAETKDQDEIKRYEEIIREHGFTKAEAVGWFLP